MQMFDKNEKKLISRLIILLVTLIIIWCLLILLGKNISTEFNVEQFIEEQLVNQDDPNAQQSNTKDVISEIITTTDHAMKYIYYIIVAAAIFFSIVVIVIAFYQFNSSRQLKESLQEIYTQKIEHSVHNARTEIEQKVKIEVLKLAEERVDKLIENTNNIAVTANAQSILLKAENQKKAQEYEKASLTFKQGIEVIKQSGMEKEFDLLDVFMDAASCYSAIEDYINAERYYKEALNHEDTEKKYKVYYELAHIHLQKENRSLDFALDYVNKAILNNNFHRQSWFLKYNILSEMKNWAFRENDSLLEELFSAYKIAFKLNKFTTYIDTLTLIKQGSYKTHVHSNEDLDKFIIENGLETKEELKKLLSGQIGDIFDNDEFKI
ncbi:hypothetical protein AJ85_04720 [Alkalihalobacillus alcalophilus ATCC 27647 = CGMCC 1.3604]|uniref:Uncharacterized protein n=1 Tax=Alkalihalobacillus alcalophilus ATCC 27647 = CGMCC 1.3604 TaxID=1218173 RepID=A0A094WFX1_ALKAL|nr:hypothetical protein [Alkalihalobacillus alcalophilus]KGA95676.1 hypothetical protein BALCAV_0220950 [Alkalihalobacillus alcalophilus ATCC 27647 = CGMCC 1.3604]MED1563234.1 hypothetical protein [Alkalihalobacillus alcalophilus]THG91458.1 hypothetical protein AJ85_04720 [Alkalihalobacillus alcalophilus ATCC 27647 = CGMCC 1.3604]